MAGQESDYSTWLQMPSKISYNISVKTEAKYFVVFSKGTFCCCKLALEWMVNRFWWQHHM